MKNTDIVFAKTVKDHSEFCEVFYADGTSDIKGKSIGEVECELNSDRGRFFRIKSALVCENNIVMIHPSQCKLVIAFDSLEKRHMELSFSEYILRRLREAINQRENASVGNGYTKKGNRNPLNFNDFILKH